VTEITPSLLFHYPRTTNRYALSGTDKSLHLELKLQFLDSGTSRSEGAKWPGNKLEIFFPRFLRIGKPLCIGKLNTEN
jgi:hypothetical protein